MKKSDIVVLIIMGIIVTGCIIFSIHMVQLTIAKNKLDNLDKPTWDNPKSVRSDKERKTDTMKYFYPMGYYASKVEFSYLMGFMRGSTMIEKPALHHYYTNLDFTFIKMRYCYKKRFGEELSDRTLSNYNDVKDFFDEYFNTNQKGVK